MVGAQRITYEAGVGHVTARDNERRAIFRDGADREHLMRVLAKSMYRKRGLCPFGPMGNVGSQYEKGEL